MEVKELPNKTFRLVTPFGNIDYASNPEYCLICGESTLDNHFHAWSPFANEMKRIEAELRLGTRT
jgi:hypothetical protein